MGGYIDGYQYDSSTTESTAEEYAQGILATSTNGGAEDLVHRTNMSTVYQLSNNGTYYAGSEYIVYGSGAVNQLGDNAAGNEWWESNVTVKNSSHAISGGAQNDSERTIYGKDGTIYVNDFDPSGNDIAYATFSQKTGVELSQSNWAPASKDNNYNPQEGTGGAAVTKLYSIIDVTLYGGDAGPPPGSPDTVASNQKIDASSVLDSELQADFTSSAQLFGVIAKTSVTSSNNYVGAEKSQAGEIYSPATNNHLPASHSGIARTRVRPEFASFPHSNIHR